MKLEAKINAINAVSALINPEENGGLLKVLSDIAAITFGEDVTDEDRQAIAGLVSLARPDMMENIRLFSETIETYIGDAATPEAKQQILFGMMDIHYGLA